MKPKRPPPRPFQVEHKPRRSTRAPPAVRTASPDGKIKLWRDDLPAPQPPLPLDKAEDILLQAEIEVHNARMRLANDPDVLQEAAATLARVDQLARHTMSIIKQPRANIGPGLWLRAKSEAAVEILADAASAIMPGVTVVKPEGNRVPRSLGGFVKQLGKDRS